MFAKDWIWVVDQPEMTPWQEGFSLLTALLDERLQAYSGDICTRTVRSNDQEWWVYTFRLRQCLCHHWRDAIAGDGRVPATRVAEQIEGGRGYRGGGKLGGNPLEDVVLAVAMALKDERAVKVFIEHYQGFAKALASKLDARFANGPDDWWFELLDHLGGYTGGTARLNRFRGHSGLRNWLGTVVWHFLRRWELPDGEQTDLPESPSPPEPVNVDESLEHFKMSVRSAIEALSKRDRLILALVYVDHLKKKQAAAILGVHPAQVGRRLERLLPDLKWTIWRLMAQRLNREAVKGILEDLQNDQDAFDEVLRQVIEEGRERDEALKEDEEAKEQEEE